METAEPQPPMPVIVQGDARALQLPDASVDLIITSPPYWSLRSYRDGGEHYDGQIGSEPTWQEYIGNLVGCTREWARVLKPSGSMFVNLGDKYGPGKSLLDLPWRYSIRCVDELDLIKRAEIIWEKPNGLPESVTDRVRRNHEVFLHLVKSPRYFAAVDEIREPHTMKPQRRGATVPYGDGKSGAQARLRELRDDPTTDGNPLGKLPGSVWEIATQPLRVPAELGIDHHAAFPMELPRRIILGWSPREVCTACGEGRRPVVERTGRVVSSRGDDLLGGSHDNQYDQSRQDNGRQVRAAKGPSFPKHESTITGYACTCPDTSAPSTPGVVLDPFGGTGTTALVAAMHGRQGISVDASHDYCRLAEWRVNDPKQRERASRPAGSKPAKPKPRPPAEVIDLPTRPETPSLFDPLDGTAS